MAFISYQPDSQTRQQVDHLLGLYRDPTAGVAPNILRIQSQSPGGLRAHFDLYSTLMLARAPLSHRQRVMIALTVSAANECHY